MKTLLILFLIALTIRLAAIFFWQFDGLYGQDAYAYFQQAVAITENLPQGQPPPADFFWPNGYPLLIAFFMLFLGQTAWAGQLAALLCGTALAPLAYLLSEALFSNETGLNSTFSTRKYYGGILAGLITAVAGQAILSSVVIMADMPALFWATLSAWFVVRGVRPGDSLGNSRELEGTQGNSSQSAIWFLAAGAALGLAVISRWLYALIGPALGLYTLFSLNQYYKRANLALDMRLLSKASPGFHVANQAKSLYWSPLLAVFSGAIILAPQMWLSLNKPGGLAHTFLLGWSPVHFWQRQFENTEGYFSYLLPMAIFYAQPAGHPAYIFPVLGLAALWASWRLWQAKRWGPLILLFGWMVPVYIFLAGISFQNFRFGLTLYLPLVILTGFGLSDLLSRSAAEVPGRKFALAPLLLHSPAVLKMIIILSLLGMLAWAYPMLNNFLTVQNRSKIVALQVEQSLPPQATLITFGLTLTLQHYTQLNTLELFYLDEASLKTLIESPIPLYLLLDLPSLETQWQGKTPQVNYHWLKENTTLIEIDAFPPYVLFQIVTLNQVGQAKNSNLFHRLLQ